MADLLVLEKSLGNLFSEKDPFRVVEKLEGKKVCIIDDVVSTGGSIVGLQKMLEKKNLWTVQNLKKLLFMNQFVQQ